MTSPGSLSSELQCGFDDRRGWVHGIVRSTPRSTRQRPTPGRGRMQTRPGPRWVPGRCDPGTCCPVRRMSPGRRGRRGTTPRGATCPPCPDGARSKAGRWNKAACSPSPDSDGAPGCRVLPAIPARRACPRCRVPPCRSRRPPSRGDPCRDCGSRSAPGAMPPCSRTPAKAAGSGRGRTSAAGRTADPG